MSDETNALKSTGTPGHRTIDTPAASKVGSAAEWAMRKAKDTLRSAADEARERATIAASRTIRKDPVRAVLIAAGVGALLMGMLAALARSGSRTVRRKLSR